MIYIKNRDPNQRIFKGAKLVPMSIDEITNRFFERMAKDVAEKLDEEAYKIIVNDKTKTIVVRERATDVYSNR